MPPHATYLFKHALVQDAAYGTLLRKPRRALHARIAETLETQFAEMAENQPELLARHCAEAGLVEKGIGYWVKEGRQAITKGAMTEAVAQLRKGLDLLSGLPAGTARQEQELNLQIMLGNALSATKGYATLETGEAYARAHKLCDLLDRPPKLGVLAGQWIFSAVRGELEQAERYTEEMRHLGEVRNDARCKYVGSLFSGHTCFYTGKFLDARVYLEDCLSSWDPKYRALATSPEDLHVLALAHCSRTLLVLGYIDQARVRRDEALAEARRVSPYALAYTLSTLWFEESRIVKSAEASLRAAEQVLAITSKQAFALWFGAGKMMRGWCLGALGQATDGIPLFLQGLDSYRATGANLGVAPFLTMLAEVYGMAAQPEQGLDRLAEAAKVIEVTQERVAEAEMLRVRGTLLLSMKEHAAAEESFHQALAVARRQQARSFELRATMSMARLWRDQGKRDKARDLLAPVYGWFTEGFNTRDLKEAKTLLYELA